MRWQARYVLPLGAAVALSVAPSVAWGAAGEADSADGAKSAGDADSAADGADGADDTQGTGDAGITAPVVVRARELRDRGLADLVGDVSRARDALRALEEAEFSTHIRTADHEGETRSLGEVLSASVGTHVRSLGGLGAFSSISVRGGASGHTPVVVDGVPQPQLGSATTDLAQLELETFSDVNLYRGNPPAHLGGGALGGALHLETAVGEPASGEPLAISAGYGSFGARHLRARYLGGEDETLAYHVSAGYGGATGDFPFYNDRGTNLNPDDSEIESRRNNAYDRADAVVRARARRGDHTYEGGGRVSFKEQGVPGPGHRQSETSSLGTLAAQLDGELGVRGPWGMSGARASASTYARLERQRYRDPDGQIGLGAQNTRYLTASGGARAGLEAPLGSRQIVSAGLSAQAEGFDETHLPGGAQGARGMRLSLGADVADEIHFAEDRLLLRPAIRLDLHHTAPVRGSAEEGGGVDGELARHTDLHPSPRVAARLRIADPLAVKASAGWYVRAPTVYELFGDRGAIVGNPELRPETGPSADAGLVLAPSGRHARALDRLFAEAVGFAKRPRDAIAFASRSPLVARAVNLEGAVIYGGELRASARLWRTITVAGNYTYLESAQRSPQESFDGRRLPNRPVHEAFARIDVAREFSGRLASVWADAAHVAGNYLDRGNFREVPARTLFGAGLKLEPISGLLVGAEVKNLTDRRSELVELSPPPSPELTDVPAAITDVFGHPLPGRAAYFTAEWRR